MSGNESCSCDREKSPSLMRLNNDQGWRNKEVSSKMRNLWRKNLREKDLRVVVNLPEIEALTKKEVPHRKSNQKCQRNDVDLEPRKTKSKSIGDIHFRHHHQTHLISILTRVNIETMRARKAQIPDLGWFLRRISTNTAYLQIWPNTPTLVLKLTSERQT